MVPAAEPAQAKGDGVSAGTGATKEKKLPPPLTPERIAELEAMKPTDRFAEVGGWSPSPNLLLEHHDKFSGHVQSILAQEIVRWTFGRERGVHEWALIKFGPLAKRANYTAKAFELALNEGTNEKEGRQLFRRKKEGRHWLCKIVPEDLKSVARYDRGGNPSPVPNHVPRDESGRFTLSDTPIPLIDGLLKGIDPAAVSVRAVSEASAPVAFTWEVDKNNVVSVVARDRGPAIPEGSVLAKESIKTGTHFATVRPLFASFHAVLDPIFLKLFGKLPDDGLLGEVVALSDGAPAEMLAERVREKIRKGVYKESGLVKDLARDCGRDWREEAVRTAWAAKAAALAAAEEQEARETQFQEARRATEKAMALFFAESDCDQGHWGAVRRAIKSQLSDERYHNWILRSRQIGMEGTQLIVAVPDQGTIIFLEDEFQPLIDNTARALQRGIEHVRFVEAPLPAADPQ
jgi:hypothetical protein